MVLNVAILTIVRESMSHLLRYAKPMTINRKFKSLCSNQFNFFKNNSNDKVVCISKYTSLKCLSETLEIPLNQVVSLVSSYAVPTGPFLNNEITECLLDDLGYNLADIEEYKHRFVERPPNIAVLGHVDHGKTTLVDYFCKSSIAANESGGITQKMGAFTVQLQKNQNVCFLDTPGHSAFSSIRNCGIKATDICIIVISVDEGIQSQTIECLDLVSSNYVPLLVVLTKIDRPHKNSDSILSNLVNYRTIVEQYGGQVPVAKISVKENTGLDQLVEKLVGLTIKLQLKSDKLSQTEGIILEKRMDKHLGCTCSAILRKGYLKIGDMIYYGVDSQSKVKQIIDEQQKFIRTVGVSMPFELSGFDKHVDSGSFFSTSKIVMERFQLQNNSQIIKKKIEFGSKESSADEKNSPITNLVSTEFMIKADLQGSLSALKKTINSCKDPRVELNVISYDLGPVTKSDINRISFNKGIIYTFNLKEQNNEIKEYARVNSVKIINFNVIYHLIDDIKKYLMDRIDPLKIEKIAGRGKVTNVFNIKSDENIHVAGCKVIDGQIFNDPNSTVFKIIRKQEVIFEGKIKSLKKNTAYIKNASHGDECGIAIEGFSGFKVNDSIECCKISYEKKELDWES